MSMAETAKLAVDLTFKSNAGTVIGGVNKQIAGLNASTAKLHKGFTTLGAGIGTAIKNGAVLATGALVALGGFLAVSVKEGQAAANVQTILSKAIANSGKVSAAQVTILNEQATALMNLAGVDDELIKQEQTRLIQMGLTGAQVAKLTPLILDMSKATGKDLLTSTLAVGKATAGNVAGLQRYGIVVDKAKAKTDPFGATLDALTKKFGGTTAALSGNFDVRMEALRQNLANIREDVGIKLLPALTRIVDVVGKALVPAFGKFVDRILPDISKGIDTFASALEGGGAEKAINGIADALGSMIDLLKIAAGPVKTIVSAFLSLPKEVQGVLVGAFAVNKLSGGLIGQGLGQIAGGLIQRGGTFANPLFVSDVTGGIGGKLLGGAAETAGGVGIAATVAGVAAALGAGAIVVAAGYLVSKIVNPNGEKAAGQPGYGSLSPGVDVMRTPFNNMFLPAAGSGGSGSWAPDLAAQNRSFRSGERATVTSRGISGQIAGALGGGKLGAGAADMAHSIRSAFQESLAPSQKSMTAAMLQLKALQARYLAQGDTKLAASIRSDILMLNQTLIDKKFTAAMSIVGSDWYNQPKPVVVKTAVTVRDVVTSTKTSNAISPIRTIGKT